MIEYRAKSLEQLAGFLVELGQRKRRSIGVGPNKSEKTLDAKLAREAAAAYEGAADRLRHAEIRTDDYDRGYRDGVAASARALQDTVELLQRRLEMLEHGVQQNG